MQGLENTKAVRFLRALTKRAGPYVLLELLLPGGTLFAALLYLYRSGALAALQPMPVAYGPAAPVQVAMAPTRVRLRAAPIVAPHPCIDGQA